jgi:hypothetical protein
MASAMPMAEIEGAPRIVRDVNPAFACSPNSGGSFCEKGDVMRGSSLLDLVRRKRSSQSETASRQGAFLSLSRRGIGWRPMFRIQKDYVGISIRKSSVRVETDEF